MAMTSNANYSLVVSEENPLRVSSPGKVKGELHDSDALAKPSKHLVSSSSEEPRGQAGTEGRFADRPIQNLKCRSLALARKHE